MISSGVRRAVGVLDGVQNVKHPYEGHLNGDEAAGRCGGRSYARRITTGTMTAEGAPAFDQDGRQHAKPITECVKVAHPVDPGMLEAGNFSDAKAFLRYAHMDQRLDLEAVTPQPPVTPG